MAVTDETKKRVDDWIRQTGRNNFGDPKETVYAGGNPLFDERSSNKAKDRYEYILAKHPELAEDKK